MSIPKLEDYNFFNKVVLLRVDFNVPLKGCVVQDVSRVARAISTIKYLIDQNAKVVIISHLGRPKGYDHNLSLKHIIPTLSELLGQKVTFVEDCLGTKVQQAVSIMAEKDVILLENLRFYKEEEQNDINFARELSKIADVYINDAFSCSHRLHASIVAVTEFLPSFAGFCLLSEIKYLKEFTSFKAKPVTVIVGGAKISTKVKMLLTLVNKVDFLIVGGAIANNFLLFNKINIGDSLYQEGVDSILSSIIEAAKKNNCQIILPEDVLVVEKDDYTTGIIKEINSISTGDIILDVGPKTLDRINNIILQSKSLLWNGPIGAFEHTAFAKGTIKLLSIVKDLTQKGKLISVIGGGDSLSAMSKANFTEKDFTYVSTGGGAFLHLLSNDEMPGITKARLINIA
ncbi:phosphoglycerate kinase [Wolbachia endosymbiont of Pentidionis agamae]|uniref:phosphoglycerate kinase n=1 Tax=Wolbachia endosymbiont of Pentidionis agamae TaxID=3110435 RepID=UPI002FCF7D76